LRCVIDAQDDQFLISIADIDAIDHEERHARNADLVRAVHDASVTKSRKRRKEHERSTNTIDHALGRSRVSRADERFDMAKSSVASSVTRTFIANGRRFP
jgi:hypothetical protein